MTKCRLFSITCAVSLGGLLFGFDSGVISGCEEAIQKEFALSPFWHGLVVAGALIGTVFGALAAGRMCDRIGRKPTLVWMGILFLISAAGAMAASSVAALSTRGALVNTREVRIKVFSVASTPHSAQTDTASATIAPSRRMR